MARDEYLQWQSENELALEECTCPVCSGQDEKGIVMTEQYPCTLCGLKRRPQSLYVVLIRRGPVKICAWCVDSIRMDTKEPWNPFTERKGYVNEKTMRCKHLLERLEGEHP